MPTARPRLSITLTEPLHNVLSRFAQLTDQSISSLVVQFLEQSAPQLERIAVMLQAAKDATPEALAQVKRTLDQAEAVLQSHQGAIMTSMDMFTRPLTENVSQAPPKGSTGPSKGRAGAGAAVPPGRTAKMAGKAAGNPPAPNRGGSSPSPNQEKPSKVVRLRDRRTPA